jgi:hypothetical protein
MSMGGKMKKLIAVFLLCLFLMPFVLADGMIIEPGRYIIERGQVAFIDYNKDTKMQKMLVGIQVDEVHGSKAAWILPVPSNPDNVAIDVLPNMPRYYGQEVKSYASRIADNLFQNLVAYQVWPVIFLFRPIMYASEMTKGGFGNAAPASIETGQSVVVYEHIEKYGVTTELVGAVDNRAIKTYLTNKGLDVPFEAYTVLDNYNGKGYTFVVSWLNQPEVYPMAVPSGESPSDNSNTATNDMMPPYYGYRQLGVQVMFKTDKAYYPLLPTSVYGSEKVPATVYITGYVEPVVPDGIKAFTKTAYMKTSSRSYPMPLYGDFSSGNTPNEYTVVSIVDAPSKFLDDDMWFTEGAPTNVKYASSFVDNLDRNLGTKAWFIVMILSVLLGSLLGFIIFREQWWKLALVSLATGLSIIGLVVALFFVKTKKVDDSLKQRIKQAGLVTVSRDFKRKFIFVLSFSVLFVIIAYLLTVLLKAPLG